MIGVILSLLTVAWLARGGISHTINTFVISSDRDDIDKSFIWRGKRTTNAYLDSSERAQATEESFFSAFPFSAQSKSAPSAVPGTQPGKGDAAKADPHRTGSVD